MKKFFVAMLVVVTSVSAMASSQSSKQSGTIVKAVVDSVLSNPKLDNLFISKINVSASAAKVEFFDQKGQCSAIQYRVLTNEAGEVTAEVDPEAYAVCD